MMSIHVVHKCMQMSAHKKSNFLRVPVRTGQKNAVVLADDLTSDTHHSGTGPQKA